MVTQTYIVLDDGPRGSGGVSSSSSSSLGSISPGIFGDRNSALGQQCKQNEGFLALSRIAISEIVPRAGYYLTLRANARLMTRYITCPPLLLLTSKWLLSPPHVEVSRCLTYCYKDYLECIYAGISNIRGRLVSGFKCGTRDCIANLGDVFPSSHDNGMQLI